MDSFWKFIGYDDDENQEELESNTVQDVNTTGTTQMQNVTMKKKEEEKKSTFFQRLKSSTSKTESQVEYYARMDREKAQREAERQKKKEEDQRKKDEEKRKADERRKMEEEVRRNSDARKEAERKKAEAERAKRSKEDYEQQLLFQKAESARLIEEQRQKSEMEIQRAREERDYQDRLRKMDEYKLDRERTAKEMEIENRMQAEHLHSMQQLHLTNQVASSAITTSVSQAASDAAAMTEKLTRELAAEKEAQKQFNLRTEQIREELEKCAAENKIETRLFVKEVDDSLHAKVREMEKERHQQLEESRLREKEREESRVRNDIETKIRQEKEVEQQRENTRIFHESSDQIRREKEQNDAKHAEEFERMRESHAAKVEAMMIEERRRMEEINQFKQQKEEERRTRWNRMMEGFAEVMRIRYLGMMNAQMEMKWDDRFNELRRSYDPVKEALWELDTITLQKQDIPFSILQFKARLDSLRMSLDTLEEVMVSERHQIETWKVEQPDALFLDDLRASVESILECIIQVRHEIEKVLLDVEIHREKVEGLERVFEHRNLEERINELEFAVNSIPTVYQLNLKYAIAHTSYSTTV